MMHNGSHYIRCAEFRLVLDPAFRISEYQEAMERPLGYGSALRIVYGELHDTFINPPAAELPVHRLDRSEPPARGLEGAGASARC